MTKVPWIAIILFVLCFIAVALAVVAGSADSKCGGVSRWDVKTLQDGFRPGVTTHSSIAQEVKLVPPKNWSSHLDRQGSERVEVEIKASIVAVGVEADSDFHLVISDGKHTMIAEIPRPECADQKFSHQFADARLWVVSRAGFYPKSIKRLKQSISCTIAGVRFFDEPKHNGTGHAKNEVEVHPVLRIQ